MVWISFLFMISLAWSEQLPKLLTKYGSESLRYISMDGKITYLQKKPGVLGLISNFRSVDFLTDVSTSNFLVTGSRDKIKLVIEVIPNVHTEYNLIRNHQLYIVNWGKSNPKELGIGRNARLHLKDEWLTYYHAYDRMLNVQNLSTQKKYQIRLAKKDNPFFLPEAVMLTNDTVIYTDVNESGHAALISYNLATKVSSVIFRAPQTATKLEICSNQDYLAIGEFPYEGVNRGSKIMHIKITEGMNLAGYETIYNTIDQDIGNMVCHPEGVYFIKTMSQDKAFTTKITDAVRLDLKTQKIDAKSSLGNVTQLIEMDGRIMIPFRGEFYVLEGESNLANDVLKKAPSAKEELPLDI
jgi:hypothetical protein